MRFKRSARRRSALAVSAVVLMAAFAQGLFAGEAALGTPSARTTSFHLTPVMASQSRPAAPITDVEAIDLSNQLEEIKESTADFRPHIGRQTVAAPAAAKSTGSTTVATGKVKVANPGSLLVGRNAKDTNANGANGCNCPAEPSAANDGKYIFAAGNIRHSEYSLDNGVSWTNVNFPAGPADAPTPFGDTDVIYERSRGVTFNSSLYVGTDSAGRIINGDVKIMVRNTIGAAFDCSYTLDDGGTSSVLMDYPHLALSNDYLYITSNDLAFSGQYDGNGKPIFNWTGAKIRRLSIDNMADCVSAAGQSYVAGTSFGVGQRVLTPAHGATDTMYLSWLDNSTTLRIFYWPDNSPGTIFYTTRGVSSTTFATTTDGPVCRGGQNNVDWTDGLSYSITGFDLRSAVGGGKLYVYWNAAPDSSHTQAHVHGATFRATDSAAGSAFLQILGQDTIFNNNLCFGIPIIGTNDRGDVGLSIGFGGSSTGTTSTQAVEGFVGVIRDQYSPGPGGYSFALVASGNYNPGRYGDYVTVRRHSPDGEFFTATAFGNLNGTATSNVNSRYVEFGRGRDYPGYVEWKNTPGT